MSKTKIGINPSQYSGPIGNAMKQVSRETVKEVLMRRDEMSEKEADELINEFKAELAELLDENDTPIAGLSEVEDLLEQYFGLEPDYLDEFLF